MREERTFQKSEMGNCVYRGTSKLRKHYTLRRALNSLVKLKHMVMSREMSFELKKKGKKQNKTRHFDIRP